MNHWVICNLEIFLHSTLVVSWSLPTWVSESSSSSGSMTIVHYTRSSSVNTLKPRPCEVQSLPTCCATHARVQFVPVYSHTYYKVDDLNWGLGCMEAFTEQPSLCSCHLRTFVCTFSKKKKRTLHYQLFTVTLWSAVRVVHVDVKVFGKKNVPFSRWCAYCRSSEWTCGRFWFRKRCIRNGL